MAVSSTTILPAQPAVGGGSLFTPFGGDGRIAPLGVYDVDSRVVGDAGGGNATVTIGFDARYTSICAWAQAYVIADTAGGDFQLQLFDNDTSLPNVRVCGVIPGVAEAFQTINSVYLWYPPPIWLPGAGRIASSFLNVDATETYGLATQIYVFDRNVRQLMAMQWLNSIRVGVNSPPAGVN